MVICDNASWLFSSKIGEKQEAGRTKNIYHREGLPDRQVGPHSRIYHKKDLNLFTYESA